MVEPTRKRDFIVTLTKSKVMNKKLEGMGYEIPAIVVDGRKGLPKMFPDKKVQLCQFHQQKTVRKYITKHPKTEFAMELKKIVDSLT